jgi:uncharacterized protein involved in outer membrane biogenesis
VAPARDDDPQGRTRVALRELAQHPKVRRRLAFAAAVVALYALIGFVAVPPLVRTLLTRKLTAALHRPTTVERVAVNPFSLSVRVRGLTVREPDGNGIFVSLDDLYANFSLSSLFHLAPVIEELRLAGLHVRIVRNLDKTYNFSDLLLGGSQPAAEPPKPLRYDLNNIQIIDGNIDFDDRPMGRVHTVRDAYVAIPFLSNLPSDVNVFVQPALRATVNGTQVSLRGRTKPFSGSRETSLDIDIRDLDVPPYLAYLPARLPVTVTSARLTTQLTLTFSQERGRSSRLVLAGRAALAGVALADAQGGELLATPSLNVRIAEADLLGGRTSLASVVMEKPRVHVSRDAAGRWNLAALGSPREAQAAPRTKTASGPRFVLEVSDLKVADGTLLFADGATKPAFAATLQAIELDARSFSTAPGTTGKLSLSFTSDAGETVRQEGEFTVEPPAASGTVEIAGVPLRRYAPYYRNAVAFDVANGVLGVSTAYAWSSEEGKGLVLSALAATLRSLRLHRTGESESFLVVPEITLDGSTIDLGERSAALGGLSVSGARLLVVRGRDGVWNLATLLAAAPPAGASPPPAPPPPPWRFAVGRVALSRASVDVDDTLPRRAVHLTLAPLRLTAQGLSTVAGVRGRLDAHCTVNGSGSLALRGDLTLNPLAARLTADVKALPLVPLQGYATNHLRLVVNDGTASALGEVTVSAGGEGPNAGFTGRASVDHLATVDAHAAEDLLGWNSLALDGVSLSTHPFRVEIARIGLTGLTARVAVAADGTMNLRRVLREAPPEPAGQRVDAGEGAAPAPEAIAAPAAAPVPSPPPAGGPPAAAAVRGGQPPEERPIRIHSVTLKGGAIGFVDRSVSPEFVAHVTGLEGSISGLSSLASSAGDVDLHATLNGQAPLSFTGKVNPLAGNLVLDLKVVGRDFDMPSVSPYSGIYAGYTIARGKLNVDLDYKVAKRRLEATNQLFLDQFDWGEKVASPKATHLPVRLAVSLLKDRDGQIHLDLPVSGSLDDPKFRLGHVILKMVVNLLVKVATSPFALLGALMGGGGHQMDAVAFAPGSAVLDAAARAQLDKLATALYDRPALRLEVTGLTDPVADREGLRQTALERAVKREKLRDLVKHGGTVPSLDAVTVEPAEYEKYLTRAYRHGKFPKPHNFLGITKAEPVPEMERRLLASLEPGPDDFRELAAGRARAVQDYLVRSGKVKADRVFIVTRATPAPSSGKGPRAGAEFSLK